MKVLIFIALLWCRLTFAQFEVMPVSQSQTVKPGEVAEVLIQAMDISLITAYPPKVIQTLGDSDSFFVYSLGPWTKNNDVWSLKGKIVFGKNFSPDKVYAYSTNTGSVQFQFKGWLWNPSPEMIPKEFTYKDIPIFSRSWWIKNWPLSLLIFVISSLGIARVIYLIVRAKRLARAEMNKKNKIREEISNAQSIKDFASLWLKRDEIKKIFPTNEQGLRAFFDELNRYQFKPSVNANEMAQLAIAKGKLLTDLNEDKHGV